MSIAKDAIQKNVFAMNILRLRFFEFGFSFPVISLPAEI